MPEKEYPKLEQLPAQRLFPTIETGTVQFNPPGYGPVTFQHKFTHEPRVLLSLSGFHAGEKGDVTSCYLDVQNVSESGLRLSAILRAADARTLPSLG